MTDEQLQVYTARITQANRTELIVIMYELLLQDITDAIEAHQKNDMPQYERSLKHASRYMNELLGCLNHEYDISNQLYRLYTYANKKIIDGMFQKKIDYVEEAKEIMQALHQSFIEVAKQDKSKPLMQNTQQVYAGLTYGKGVLNEISMDPNHAFRGFKA